MAKKKKAAAGAFAEGDLIFDLDDVLYRITDGVAASVKHGGALRGALETEAQRGRFSYEPRHGVTGRLPDGRFFRAVRAEEARHGAYDGKKGAYYHALDNHMHLVAGSIEGPFKSLREAYFVAAGLEPRPKKRLRKSSKAS